MSWEIEKTTCPVAEKDYHCEASDWIDNTIGWEEEDFEEEDRPIIRKALSEGLKILKGTEYLMVSGKWEGEFTIYRARKDLDGICQKYDLYPDGE